MSTDTPVPIEDRLDALERTFDFTLNARSEVVHDIHRRLVGLQEVLERKGVLRDPDVRARMQAISDSAELELEYSDDPELKRFRELRRLIKGKLDSSPEGTS